MGSNDQREMMSAAAARSCWETGRPAGVIDRWTPMLTAASARIPEGRPAIVGQMGGLEVRISMVGDRFVIGQRGESAGRPGALVWFYVASHQRLADAHALAWRILTPMDPAQGVLAQLAAAGVPITPGRPG